MYSHLPEALKYFHDNGLGDGRISTNGVFLNDRNIELLSKYVKHVLVCLDSADPSVYSEIRGPHFELVKSNIQKFIDKSGCRIEIQHLMTNNNTADDISSLFKMRPGVSVYYKTAVKWNGTKDYRRQAAPFPCTDFTHFIIAVDGRVTMCCMDFDIGQPIGNIKDHTFTELWNGAEALRQKNADKRTLPVCKVCSCLPLYGGAA